MKKRIGLCGRVLAALLAAAQVAVMSVTTIVQAAEGAPETDAPQSLQLWYNKPATNYNWVSSSSTNPNDLQPLTIGNGYMGAAFYGSLQNEKLQLSEKTIWKSGPNSRPDYSGGNKTGANTQLADFRDAVFSYDQDAADAIMNTGDFFGKGYERGAYQTFGDLNLSFDQAPSSTPEDYRRYLDLDNAVGGVEYTSGGVRYTREYLANYPDNVLALRLSASEAGRLNFTVNLSPLVTEKIGSGKETKVNVEKQIENNDTLTVTANLKSNDMKIASQVRVLNQGGALSATGDNDIRVDGADSVVLLLAIGTNYKNEYPDYVGEDPLPSVTQRLDAAVQKGYAALREEHIADYQEIFSRVTLDVGQLSNNIPTDELLRQYQAAFKAGNLNDEKYRELEVLAYQFGRYALIASSRPGTMPANLQGVWNDNNNPMFSSDYHLNVNVEMNYWQAMSGSMGETMLPLIEFVESLVEPGRVTAREYTGVEGGGWMTNCSTNIFGYTSPHDNYNYALNPASAAWLCETVFEYYRFTLDEDLLRDHLYPMMKEAAEYLSKLLVEDPRDGTLVVSPSYSSEHGPITAGTTYEQSLAYQLFSDVIEVSKTLGDENDPLIVTLSEQVGRLDPLRVGEWGQIKEWREEDIVDIGRLGNMEGEGEFEHRHTSHLLGLFPLSMITAETPEYFEAARVSLDRRGFGQTGWSRAMKMNEWARLLDGESALKMYQGILAERTIANLFDTHPPFQIDGTLGLSSGVNEMLLQSHAGYVQPLPALPEEWATGSFNGLSARGNFVIDAQWEDGSLTGMQVLSNKGAEMKLRYNSISESAVLDSKGNPVAFTAVDADNITFATAQGETYTITPKTSAPTTIEREAVQPRPEPVATSYSSAFSLPAGFEEIGVSERELPISRVPLPGNDGADIRMYYDSQLGDLSFIAYQLPAKNKDAVVEVVSEETGMPVARAVVPVEDFSGFQADFQAPANLDGRYRLTISIDGEREYVARTFTLTQGEDVYDLASLRQEYDRSSCLLSRDYTDGSWAALQGARTDALALLETEELPSLDAVTTAREQLRIARENLTVRCQTEAVAVNDSSVATEGGWQFSGGKLTSTDPGDTLSVSFYGEGIQMIGRTNTDCGKMEVYLDGQLDKTVDLYSFENTNDNCVLYSKRELPLGNHSLTIKHVDGRNYATGQKIVFNQFKVDAPNQGILVEGDNLLTGKPASVDPADATYSKRDGYEPDKCVDGDTSTRWATNDNTSPTITFDLQGETDFNRLVIQEASGFSNRVSAFEVDALVDGEWKRIHTGVGIGDSSELALPQTTASKLRIHFSTSAAPGVTLSEVKLFQSHTLDLDHNNTAQAVAEGFSVCQPSVGATQVIPSAVPRGFEAVLTDSEDESVIGLDGSIRAADAARQVELIYRITKLEDQSTAEAQVIVTVPARPGPLTAQAVADSLYLKQPALGDRQIVSSILPAGYQFSIIETSHPDLVAPDGKITTPGEETEVALTLRVVKLSDGSAAERKISVLLPAQQVQEDVTYACNDPAVTYSTSISSGTSGVRNQWFYSANSQDYGGKVLAYNYQSGENPWFEIAFEGEQISLLNRTKGDQANILVSILNSEGDVVAGPTLANCKTPNGAYQQTIYTSPQLEPGRYTLRGVGQPSKAGEYTILNAFKVSGRKPGSGADKTALNAVIAESDALLVEGAAERVTNAQKQAFLSSYNNALDASGSMTAEQETVDAACAALEEAVALLKAAQPDKSELNDVIAKAESLNPFGFEDFTAVEAALVPARTVQKNPYANQNEIDFVCEALRRAVDALVPVTPAQTNAAILNKVIDKAQELQKTDEYLHAIDSVRTAFDLSLENAVGIRDNPSATQLQIDAAWVDLMTQIHKLGLQQGNKDSLREHYTLYSQLDLNLYLDGEAKENFKNALAAAEAMLRDTDAVQNEVDAVDDALVLAATALVKRGDKTNLQTTVDSTAEYVSENYAKGWDAFTAARDAANEVLGNPNATQEQVDEAVDNLINAMLDLRLKADKKLLKAVIASAEGIDLSGYSAETVETFQSALNEAKATAEDETLTAKEDQWKVNAAVDALSAAVEGLAKADGTPAGLTVNGDGSITAGAGSAKTGERTPLALAMAALLVAGSAVVLKKRKY